MLIDSGNSGSGNGGSGGGGGGEDVGKLTRKRVNRGLSGINSHGNGHNVCIYKFRNFS